MSAPNYRGVYVVNHVRIVVATAITILQVKAGANPIEIIKATLSQNLSETSTQEQVQLLRKSAAATVTSATPIILRTGDPVALAVGGTAATGITATVEGTDGDILISDGFNILSGWVYLPVPEERIKVDPAGIIAMKFPVAPASATWTAQIIFGEL